MKVLIIGASSKTSIGYGIGDFFEQKGQKVVYTSRSGKLGIVCDVTDPIEVEKLIKKEKPTTIILAAGVFLDSHKLGSIKKWNLIKNHILAKGFGSLAVLDAAIKYKSVKQIIIIAGRATSSDPTFAPYSLGNGALWALVNFGTQHSRIKMYYVDLPLIENSTIANKYAAKRKIKNISVQKAATMDDVIKIVEKILDGGYKNGSRIILKKESTL